MKSCVLISAVGAALAFTGCGSNNSSQSPPPCQITLPPPSGLEVLYGINNSGLLNQFVAATIDPGTGALSPMNVVTPPTFGGGIVAVHAHFLYISGPPIGFSSPSNWGLFGYSLDQASGAPTSLSGSPFSLPSGAFPQGLATLPNSYFLYAADSGRIDAYTVDSKTGVPTPIPGSPFTSGTNWQLAADPSGKFLYASDDDPPGGVLAFTVSSNGALTPVPGSPFTVPGQTVENSQPFGIVDTGKFVYAGLEASNQIAAFSIDSGSGALTPVPGSPFAAGSPPGVLALANNFLYATTGQGASVSGFNIDPSTGALTPVPGSPFSISDSATLAADTSGRYLYVCFLANLYGFNIDPCTGALTRGAGSYEGNDGALWMTVVEFPSSGGQ
jgi:6-phosphogluconolactonase (cycloisomerase 2 family)